MALLFLYIGFFFSKFAHIANYYYFCMVIPISRLALYVYK